MTIRAIQEFLNADRALIQERPHAYTTTQTVVRNLASRRFGDARIVTVDVADKVHRYTAVMSRDEIHYRVIREAANLVANGDFNLLAKKTLELCKHPPLTR